MKKSHISAFLAVIAIISATSISCKNQNKKITTLTAEQLQEQEVALADSVLAILDGYAQEYQDYIDDSFKLGQLELTSKEKLIKPDFLLDADAVNLVVTRSQKINVVAIYLIQRPVRELYGMPVKEITANVVKLAADIGYPIDNDIFSSELSLSQEVKREYDRCKENGDVPLFWQLQRAIIITSLYIVSRDPEMFLDRITPQEWTSFYNRAIVTFKAAALLAQYDPSFEMMLPSFTLEEIESYASLSNVRSAISTKSAQIQQQYFTLFK